MLEYASMRLIDRWGIATTFPTVYVTIARIASVATQSTWTLSRPMRKTRNSATMPTFFDADVRSTLIVVGEPWYTSGAHMWNGTTATLNPKPARRKTIATINGGSIEGTARPSPGESPDPFSTLRSVRDCPNCAIELEPATPYTMEIPKRMIALDTAPMMKNFKAASVAALSFFRKATRAKVLSELISNARYSTKRSVAAAVSIIPTTARNRRQ